ncbi:MAG: ornithine carbamoyltransferase [Candidatus Micrarchaeota archaeon]
MDFLKITDITPSQLGEILSLSAKLKKEYKSGVINHSLEHKTLAMIFAKPSTRTRVSFEAAMTQLGGHAIYLDTSTSQVSRGETWQDTGLAVGSMADAIMARVHSHSILTELAAGSPVPVISGLSAIEHPCQILADLLTISECSKNLAGGKLAYVGDCANNVANSLMVGCAMAGMDVSLVGPASKKPGADYLEAARSFSTHAEFTTDAKAGLADADVVYTDTWLSMGDAADEKSTLSLFAPYQVNAKLMAYAKKDAIFMHCLPAHRGQEVSAEVIDGKQSVVGLEASNRLHAQKGLLVWLLGA